MTTKRPSSRTPRPKPPATAWQRIPGWSKWLTGAAAAVAAGLYLTANVFTPIALSRLPTASQDDVKAVVMKVDGIEKEDGELHKSLVDRLNDLANGQKQFANQQSVLLSDRLTNSLQTTGSALDHAKQAYQKDPTVENAELVNVLQKQFNDLQAQLKAEMK